MSKCTIIEKLLEEMQQNMIMAGIKEINYIKTIKHIQTHSDDFQEKFYSWLLDFKAGIYAEVVYLYNELPPHVWDHYNSVYGPYAMPEQIVLVKRRKQLRTLWRNRPKYKKVKTNEEETEYDDDQEISD